MAKPTWTRTQSPGTGLSSCKRPRSILRRTPTTSTRAESWLSEETSTIFPGMARHIRLSPSLVVGRTFGWRIGSVLFARRYVKRYFQFVLELDGSSHRGNRLYLVIALADGKTSRGPEFITVQREADGDGLSEGHAVQSQFAIQRHPVLAFRDFAGREAETFVHNVGKGIALEDVLVHGAVYFSAIFLADVIGVIQRPRVDDQAEGTLFHCLGIQYDLALEI